MPTNISSLPTSDANIELRSEDVTEVLGKAPNWVVMWGLSILSAIFFALLWACCIVKYPDTLTARIALTTKIPPTALVARADGMLRFLVDNNSPIDINQPIAVIENTANLQDVLSLIGNLNKLKNQDSLYHIATILNKNYSLGELQPSFSALKTSYETYQSSVRTIGYKDRLDKINAMVHYHSLLNKELLAQQNSHKQELEIAKKKKEIDEDLFKNKVISESDLDRSKSSFLALKRACDAETNNILNNDIALTQLYAQGIALKMESKEADDRLRRSVYNLLKQFQTDLELWKHRYLVISPMVGEVVYDKIRSNFHHISPGQLVVTIVPSAKYYYGQVLVPMQGSGKIKPGQKVNIKFDAYPDYEFGLVVGRVEAISPLPSDGYYQVDVQLANGLVTTYRKKLKYNNEMQGHCDIITDDISLAERFFAPLRAILSSSL